MKRIAAITALALCIACPTFARIGETYEQLGARYGTPKDHFEDVFMWKFNGMNVSAVIENGKCVSELYSNSAGFRLTRTQIADLLQANGNGLGWKPTWTHAKDGVDGYEREDGKAFASVASDYLDLQISSSDIVKSSDLEPQKAAHLKGF